MKNILIGFFAICIFILSALGISMVSGKSIRQNELDSMVSGAVEDTIKLLVETDAYAVKDEKQFVTDQIQNALIGGDSKSVYQVNVYGVSKEKGFIDVEVIEKYPQPFKPGKVSVRKTAMVEDYEQDSNVGANIYYTVTFRTKGELLKQYSVSLNTLIPVSMIPEGYTEWIYNGKAFTPEEIATIAVKQDMTITGVK